MKRTEAVSDVLSGKNIAITGKLFRRDRDKAFEQVRLAGGTPASAVSSTTDFLVAGEGKTGSKHKKAQALGIPVIDEDQFDRLLKTGSIE